MRSGVFIIAEAGVNHNGDADMALELVEAAAACGADAIKFQTFKADKVVGRDAPKAQYQTVTTGTAETQFDMLQRLELSDDAHHRLKARCAEKSIEFMSTPFDEASVDFLAETVGVARIKIPSGEITNGPLLLHAARLGLPIILSTGMSTLEEVEQALVVLAHGMSGDGRPDRRAWESESGRTRLRDRVSLLHCTSEYPAPYGDINLNAIETLRQTFGLPVGLSDHSVGIAIPIAAVACGAQLIEKHFTLDRSLPGPDHEASIEVAEFAEMVKGVRVVEQALGNGLKAPAASEQKNINIIRRSLVAARPIAAGEMFSRDNVVAKRPAGGVSPMRFWEMEGRRASRSYDVDQPIEID